MANSYYGRIHEYLPRTRAMGENVREDYDSVTAGFDKLPPHNSSRTGFDSSFIVVDPTNDKSPLPYHQFKQWPHDLSAHNYRLTDLHAAINDGDAVNFTDLKNHVYHWQYTVNAQQHQLKDLADPDDDTDAVNIRSMKSYVDNQLKPEVPDGGLTWPAPVAKGGETVLNPPYQFTMVAVKINGVEQDRKRGAYSIDRNTIYLSEALEKGDEALVVIGEPRPPSDFGSWTLINDDYSATSGDKLLINSKEKPFKITLPEITTPNAVIQFLDIGEALNLNPVTIAGNGHHIMGTDDNLDVRTNAVSFQLLFINQLGWRVLE